MHTVTRTAAVRAAARAAARAQATRAAARDARGRAARDGCAASTVGAARRASANAIFKLACLLACLLTCLLACLLPSVQLDEPRNPQVYHGASEAAPQRKSGLGLRDCHFAEGRRGGTHAKQTNEQRVQGGPCTWAARRGPQPPARRPLAAASRTRHERFSFASGTPAACDAPQQPLHHASPPQQLSSSVPCTTWTPAAARGAFELQLHALRRAGRSMDRAGRSMDRADRPSPTRSPPHAIDQASG